ncbi:MAG TPA: tetratricopeptide repeat protein [Pyrinomonadaceae bacterium]|jgi:tetratricopeptide (TPR) repeat protein
MRTLRQAGAAGDRKFPPLAPLLRFGFVIFLLAGPPHAGAQTQREGSLTVIRRITVNGRVSLKDDRPATRARVRLSSQSGITRETVTSDSGRYEFTEVPPGSYQLTATSLTDSALVSDSIELDTSQVITGFATVNLSFTGAEAKADGRSRPGVITAAEAEQKVPKEAHKAFKHGLELKNNSSPAKALESFSQAIELYPEYFQALSERGDLYVSTRELAKAAADFERALKINPLYEPALRGAGYCKLEGKEFAQAAQYLEQAVTADPGNASSLLLLGIANLELDHREQAAQALRQALKIDALRAVRAHIHLANLYAREHQYRKAADELRAYIDEMPSDPGVNELKKVEAQWRAHREE